MRDTDALTHITPIQIVQALWAGDASANALIAPDAVILDQDQGAMSLRSFTALKRHLRAALPDHTTHIEEVFWSGADTDEQALFRLIHTATHTRDGPLGPATYARLAYRSALRVQMHNATVVEVAMFRDQTRLTAALSQGLGTFGKIRNNGVTISPIKHPWAAAYADIITAAMDGDFSVFARSYAPSVEIWRPGGQPCLGQRQAEHFWLTLRAALPTGQFAILSGYGADDTVGPPRVGIHWRLSGAHLGWGLLGKPSKANLMVEGISFAEFGLQGIHREWTVIDLNALHRHIASALPQKEQAA